MTEVFSCSLNTHSPSSERVVPAMEASAVRGRLRNACVKALKSCARTFIQDCRQRLAPRSACSSGRGATWSGGRQSNPAENSRIAVLSAALDAEKGMRAKAIHLVVVEQTLRQEISGGLGAVPADVLRLASSQLAGLAGYRSAPELKHLLHSMLQIVESAAKVSESPTNAERHGLSDSSEKNGKNLANVSKMWVEPSRRQFLERAESIADDDFPDTEAFSRDEVDIPLPMPQMGGGSTEKIASNQKQV